MRTVDPALRECYSEFLPTADYAPGELNFRLTARDRRATGGGVGHDDVKLKLAPAAGPFRVTDTQTGADPGGPLAVTWDVAGTAAAPVGVTAVKISLSSDGGATFPTVLAESTPNDGAETVTVPATTATAAGRIKVEAIGNVFFDVSHTNLTLVPGAGPAVPPTPTPAPTPTTPTEPTGMAPLRPNLSGAATRLSVSRTGSVPVRLTCAAAGSGTEQSVCRGSIRLRTRLGAKIRTIGTKPFVIPRTETRTFRVKLSKRALRTLKRKRLKASLRVQVRNPGTAPRNASLQVTIRRR